MTSEYDPYAKKHASVYANEDFVCVECCAGYRRVGDEQTVAFLPRDASDDEVGRAVMEALNQYRVLAKAEIAEFFDLAYVEARHNEWVQDLCARAGYKSAKDIYRHLRHVLVRLVGSDLSVSGTAKDERNGFEGNGFSLTVDVSSGPSEVGIAVKKALAESV